MGELVAIGFLTPGDLDGLTKLNHALCYLEDRRAYPGVRATLYAGLIEVN